MKKIMTSALVCVGAALAVVALAASPPAMAATHVEMSVVAADEVGNTSDKLAPEPAFVMTIEKATYQIGQATLDTDFPVTTAKATASSDTIYSGKEARVTVSCGDVAGLGHSCEIGGTDNGQTTAGYYQQHRDGVRLDC